MNNLKKFSTEAEYGSATLNYPAVSWVTGTDTVHFDKSAPTPPTVNDKVIMAAYGGSGEATFTLFNCEALSSGDITSIIFDDVEVNPNNCEGDYVDAEQTYIVKYTITGTTVGDWFSGDLGCGEASAPSKIQVLIPSQITYIESVPTNASVLVIEATTPPSTSMNQSSFQHPIYVPDSALSTFQNDATWGEWGELLRPISDYSGGILPV